MVYLLMEIYLLNLRKDLQGLSQKRCFPDTRLDNYNNNVKVTVHMILHI